MQLLFRVSPFARETFSADGSRVAVLALMLIETMLIAPPQGAGGRAVPPALGRLTTARYALAALLIALVLAQPAALKALPLGFVAIVTLAAAGFAMVPLGKRKAAEQ